jgi:hypothetical protein
VELMTETLPWFTDHSELVTFGWTLEELGEFGSPGEVLYFMEKPWKWEDAHQSWIEHNRPGKEDTADWQAWIDAMTLDVS